MTILSFILIVCVIGLVLYLVMHYLPMDPMIKQFLVVAVVIMLVIWLLQLIGVLGAIDAPIPRVR